MLQKKKKLEPKMEFNFFDFLKKWYFILFQHSAISFEKIHQIERESNGTYAVPYSVFKEFQRKTRITSAVSAVFFILSVGISIIYGPYGPRETAIASAVSWDGGGDGVSWANANNWSNDQAPGSTDDVTIDASVTVDIATSTTINSLTLGPNNNPTLNFSYDAITNGALVMAAGNLSLNTGSTITHTAGSNVVAGTIFIDVQNGSATVAGNFNLAGTGFSGGVVGANGNGNGGGIHEDVGNGGGGGHGGAGGAGNSVGSTGGVSYGSLTTPTTLGSAGAGGTGLTTIGGAGGGVIRLNAKGNISVSGNVRAWGNQGIDVAGVGRKCGGGGAGGSIFIVTQGTLSGAGSLSVAGGAGGSCNLLASAGGGGGGGGRIRLEYVTDSFTGSKVILAGSGGTGYEGSNGQSGSNGSLSTKQYIIPNTPSITSPTNSSAVSSFTPTLTSSSYSGDISHSASDWEIDDNEDFSSATWSSYNDSANKENITVSTTLSPNTLYYVRVRHANGAGNSSYSSGVTFWTPAITPGALTLSSPTTSSINITVANDTNPATTQYAFYHTLLEKYVTADGTLGTVAIWKTKTDWSTLTVSGGLLIGSQNTFQAKARNTVFAETSFSQSASLSTLAETPDAPTLGNSTLTTMDLTIFPRSNAASVSYALLETVSGSYVGSIGIFQSGALWRTVGQWGGTVTIRGLVPRTHYTFCVKAKNPDGVETSCSSSSINYTLGRSQSSNDTISPSVPTNIKAEEISNGGVRIAWQDPPEADFVAIFLYRGVQPIPPSGNPYMIIPRGKGQYIDNDVQPEKTYQYQLRARDLIGNVSDITQIVSVIITSRNEEPSSDSEPPTEKTLPVTLLPITDLQVIERYNDGIKLGFTMPDLEISPSLSLDIRYANQGLIDEQNFDSANHYILQDTDIFDIPNANIRLIGFSDDTYLSLAIKLVSTDGTVSPISNVVTSSTIDIVPPGPIEKPKIIYRIKN